VFRIEVSSRAKRSNLQPVAQGSPARQTNFTAEQLRDPDTAESNRVLRTCVHCGFCTATCPTFLLLGDELDSPGGRIYLMKDTLDSGRPAHHLGQHDRATASARANIEACSREIDGARLDAVIVNASGMMMKDYGFLFRTQPAALRSRAQKVSAHALDISEYLTRIGYAPTLAPPGLKVAYHAAYSLQHGQRVNAEPKAPLRRASFTVVEAG